MQDLWQSLEHRPRWQKVTIVAMFAALMWGVSRRLN
jgi:hypothetical protein